MTGGKIMNYTEFGNTKERVSRLGFGCMRLPMKYSDGNMLVDEQASIDMLRKGIELGINYFDNGYIYCNSQSERILGNALEGRRDKVILSTKCPGQFVHKHGDYRRILEEQLTRLKTDHIDFYHFHGINHSGFTEIDKNTGWHGEAVKAKDEGLIKHIPFSFHSRDFHSSAPDDMIKLIDTLQA